MKKILILIVFVFVFLMFFFNVVCVFWIFWEDVVIKKYFGVIYYVCVIGILINLVLDFVIYLVVVKDF